MKLSFVQKLFFFGLHFIQASFVAAVIIVNHLANTKAGVYRHVYTRKMQYMEGIYHPSSIQWQSLIVLSVCAVLFILLYFSLKKNKGLLIKVQLVLAVLLGLFVILVMNSELFRTMMAYPYFIMIFQLVFAIQLLIVVILSLNKSKQ